MDGGEVYGRDIDRSGILRRTVFPGRLAGDGVAGKPVLFPHETGQRIQQEGAAGQPGRQEDQANHQLAHGTHVLVAGKLEKGRDDS